MPLGKGRYDDVATEARHKTQAQGVALIVLDGKHGNGFSVQCPAHIILYLPDMLRQMADAIEQDTRPSH